MRRGLLIVGIVLLLLGVIAAAVPMALPASTSIPPSPSALIESPNLLGSGTLNLHWSGASDQTNVTVYECDSSACANLVSRLGGATGSSGSISVPVSGGTWYAITETGSSTPVSATLGIVGLTTLVVIGVILAVLGAVLALVGMRTTAKPRVAEPPRSGPSTTGSPSMGSAPAAGSASDSHIMEAAASPAALTAGSRPTLICAHCGAANEPWLTNCRKCQRTLTSTGTG